MIEQLLNNPDKRMALFGDALGQDRKFVIVASHWLGRIRDFGLEAALEDFTP